jgi:trk system potassium uptake protein TrkA
MRIAIVGAGKLGYSLADYLTREEHEVVVVEIDDDHREIIKNNLDILTIEGNGANPQILSDPDVKSADILIASTYSDEVNMVVCMMAKKIGIKQTVARIRGREYTGLADSFIREVTGIDLVLNPERIIAQEIDRLLSTPFALDMGEFADGEVKIFETRVEEGFPYLDKTLIEIDIPPGLLVAGIMRKNKVIIPRGSDSILLGDIVFFIGLKDTIAAFEGSLGRPARKVERALIIGAGRVGRYLAPSLESQGISVKVIEKSMERCEQISELLHDGIVICGDGASIDLLLQEGVREADVVICLTEDDKLNLLLALLSKHLGAPRAIVKTAHTEYADLIEEVDAGLVVSTRLLSIGEVLRFVRRKENVVGVSLFEGARVEVIELVVGEDSPVAGVPLVNAELPPSCLVCAIVHEGRVIIPHGNTVPHPGDRAVVFVEEGAAKTVLKRFS